MNVSIEPAPRAFGPHAWDDTIPAHYEACVVPVLEMLAPLAAQHDAELHIVDLGCGVGRLAFPAAMAMPEATIIGVDISRAALDALEASADALDADNVCSVLGDGRTLPDEAMGVDAVFSFGMFQEIPWATAWGYIRCISRALLPGGVVRLQFVEGDQAVEGDHRYPTERVAEALERFGLAVVAIDRGLVQADWTFITARKAH